MLASGVGATVEVGEAVVSPSASRTSPSGVLRPSPTATTATTRTRAVIDFTTQDVTGSA